MKYLYLFFALVLLGYQSSGKSKNNFLQIKNPQVLGSASNGILRDVNLEVTPQGLYAQVDMTFTIAIPSGYTNNQLLEGVLFFDLPAPILG